MIIVEPLFYAAAIPAVLLYGIAKGGFAAPLAILGVPLMALEYLQFKQLLYYFLFYAFRI